MWKFISSTQLISNFFKVNPDKDLVSINDLGKLSLELNKNLAHDHVAILWTRDDLSTTLSSYSDLFSKKDNMIIKLQNTKEFYSDEYMSKVFNKGIPSKLMNKIQEILQENQ